MKLLSLGNEYFRSALIRAGVEVVQAGPESGADLKIDPDQVDLAALLERVSPPPDVLLLTDDLGRRVLPWGLERCRLPKVYYAVDTPINFYWQRHLAGLFDLVVADQKDCALALSEQLSREVIWLPVAIDPALYQGPEEEEKNDFAFVGTLEPTIRPKRSGLVVSPMMRAVTSRSGTIQPFAPSLCTLDMPKARVSSRPITALGLNLGMLFATARALLYKSRK